MASAKRKVLLLLTLLLSGRAMTLAFIARAGGDAVGDPPAAWLMPLVGDAIIGMTAVLIAYLIWQRVGLLAWTAILVWNVVAIWDAFSAFLIHWSVPWPSFFMTEIFGSAMFFAAAAMHGLCLYLVAGEDGRKHFLGSVEHINATSTLIQKKAGGSPIR